MMRRVALAALLATLTSSLHAVAEEGEPPASDSARPPRVHAPSPGNDGVYGRFDGSLSLALAGGVELEAGEPRGALRVAGHYFWTAGAYARYSDAFGSADERPARVASFGIDLRPLFLPRFALDAEQGPAFLDLALDSVALTAGAYFAEPIGQSFGDERGFEAGLGLGLPLFGSAAGPWLEARAERRFADRDENAWLLSVSVAWHALTWSTEPDR